jgi:hypothetical protein
VTFALSKVVHEIETRGQEVIDMVKNATAAMINIVNANESKERTRIRDEIGLDFPDDFRKRVF